MRQITVARCFERIGDNAVDIGEQTAFLVTGEFAEFTDASHDTLQRRLSSRSFTTSPPDVHFPSPHGLRRLDHCLDRVNRHEELGTR